MIESESVAIQCALRRDRESGEKESERLKRECPAGDRLPGVVCEKSPVFIESSE